MSKRSVRKVRHYAARDEAPQAMAERRDRHQLAAAGEPEPVERESHVSNQWGEVLGRPKAFSKWKSLLAKRARGRR